MKVIIVGGGFCGAFVAKKIEKHPLVETILIDQKPYYEYSPNLHKVITNKNYIKKLQLPYEKIVKHTTIICDKVQSITPSYVQTTQEKIFYDYLIISTGIEYPIRLKNTENVHVLKNGTDSIHIADTLSDANKILIVGGGIIGTEIAGEIATKLPNKEIIVVHSHKTILERNGKDAAIYALQYLKKRGVTFIFGEKVNEQKDGVFITDKDQHLPADLCLWCTGIRCNPSYMKGFDDHCFSDRNALQVNNTLQLIGHPHIFVGGDINSIKEEKTARKAELHAKIISKNIIRSIEKKSLLSYKTGRSPMIIGLDDWRGIFEYKYVFVGLMFPGMLKWFLEKWVLFQLKKKW